MSTDSGATLTLAGPGAAPRETLAMPGVTRLRHPLPLVVVALLLLFPAIWGMKRIWHHYLVRVSTDDAFVDARVAPIASKLAASVSELLVSDNQAIEAGDVLVRLDPRDQQVKLDQAKTALAVAESLAKTAELAVEGRRSQLRIAETAILGARASSFGFGAELALARGERERSRTLRESGLTAQQELDHAEAGLKVASARVDAGIGKVAEAIAEAQRAAVAVKTAILEAETAKNRVEEARAAVAESELRLEYTTIRAPFRGRVTKRNVELGQIVQVGQPLLAIVSTDDVWIVANFKESQLANVRPGQPATVEVDMLPSARFTAHVDSIQAGTGSRFAVLPAENATGNFVKVMQRVPVKLVLDPGQQVGTFLPAGISVVPTILVE